MLYDYQREELKEMAQRAEHAIKGACPLVEDEALIAVYQHILELENFVQTVAANSTVDHQKTAEILLSTFNVSLV